MLIDLFLLINKTNTVSIFGCCVLYKNPLLCNTFSLAYAVIRNQLSQMLSKPRDPTGDEAEDNGWMATKAPILFFSISKPFKICFTHPVFEPG